MTIAQTVSAHLAGQPIAYIADVASHGIHNLANEFQGDTDAEYDEFTREFASQADSLLAEFEAAQHAEFA